MSQVRSRNSLNMQQSGSKIDAVLKQNTVISSKHDYINDLKSNKHINVAELLKKRIKNSVIDKIRFSSPEATRNMLCLDLII